VFLRELEKEAKMGFFGSGRKVEEAKMALVGKYLFESLTDDQKKQVLNIANNRLRENNFPQALNELEEEVQWVFWALAMAEMNIDHGLKAFKWRYIRNPFMIAHLDDAHWKAAAEILSKKNQISFSPH
jgi:hypothetical protein